jgi:hypothetical protein
VLALHEAPLATKVSQLPFSRNGDVEVEQEGEGRRGWWGEERRGMMQ